MPTKTITAIVWLWLSSLMVCVNGQTKQQVDREYDGLRDRVKTVSVDEARFDLVDRKWVAKPRLPYQRITYDEVGNQTRFELYDEQGNPADTLVYGFIDKQRIAINSSTRPGLTRVEPLKQGQRADPRYTYRFVHRYDAQGRRIQTLVYHSGGELYLRHVFQYVRNQKTRLTYSKGKLNLKQEYLLNDQGDEVRMIDHSRYLTAGKTIYQYEEFDARGNWTRRRVYKNSKEFTDSEITSGSPWSIEYRVITYY